MGDMGENSEVPNLMCLPDDLIRKIGAHLNDKDECRIGRASKRLYDLMLQLSPTRPCTLYLDCTDETISRWHQKRLLRYDRIHCDYCDAMLRETEVAAYIYPPLLPYLLAFCAPGVELSLIMTSFEGEDSFFRTASAIAKPSPAANRRPGSYWATYRADLVQHLTELRLTVDIGPNKEQDLETISVFTALRRLEITSHYKLATCRYPCHDLSEGTITLRLPNLVDMELSYLQNGELVLSCPKLADVRVEDTKSLVITVESAALEGLWLMNSEDLSIHASADQLQELRALKVRGCWEVWPHELIEDVYHMKSLRYLEYVDFSQGCMPSSFPQSLQEVALRSYNWSQNLPTGLKDLPNLTKFEFESESEKWEITAPLADFLPVRNLEYLVLGSKSFLPRDFRQIGFIADIRCTSINQQATALGMQHDPASSSISDLAKQLEGLGTTSRA